MAQTNSDQKSSNRHSIQALQSVIKRNEGIKLSEELALGTIRVSLGKYNTVDEARQIAEALIKVVS